KLSEYLAGNIRYETFRDFELTGNTITSVITSEGKYTAKSFVVTSGYFTKQILSRINFPMLMESGKGYSFKVPMHSRLNTPLILTEARVAVTPLDGQIQFAGTMQIGRSMRSHTRGKIRGIVKSVGDYLPGYKMEDQIPAGVWAGLRPLSPDGLPYIGKSERFSNLYIGAGHAMMGISLAPVTGRILTDTLTGKSQPDEFKLLSPDRF
ncbi:MAG: FAD-binding oxidoreductase, partial [Bacteroidales bacterium]|nr:FAD-binding oxidoreductase [Bacteroidales bacterium]